ncbi:MAG TPA: ATP-binding protein [Candidatus Saccharimonadales bacterium]|jgi:signal transduction histidine kinase|nr:ATP-binding protein [Candidatus Saccharimonadales bacterium]
MFKSATLKLTIWYVIILVCISLLFSVVIYSIALSEIGARIANLQNSSSPMFAGDVSLFNLFRAAQLHEAQNNLIGSLVITNLIIWFAGGFGSYYLARRTLRPIEEAHEAQSKFTSDASHELRTPLASMKIELEVALRDPSTAKAEMRELLESNLEEVNRLTKLSHTLLQLSKLEHDEIVRENVDISRLSKTVIERFNKIHPRITLHDRRNVQALANESNVEELLTILIDNALKYSPIDTTVTVTLVKQRQMSGFKVVNAGEGIPAESLPHIFNRFYRADASRTGSAKNGYGLGLSLAKKIVELHDGELTVSSAVDQDTTFQVMLPNIKRTPPKLPHISVPKKLM